MILVYIGQQIFSGRLLVGDFIAFSFAIGLLQDSVKKLQASYLKLQQAAVALERMRDIMNTSSTVPDPRLRFPLTRTGRVSISKMSPLPLRMKPYSTTSTCQ